MSATKPVTPAELRELAARARALADDIEAVRGRFRAAGDEPTRRVGFRLDARGWTGNVAVDLEATAGDLARVRSRGGCPCDWGVCPDHGNTLRSSGGRCWCTAPGCHRVWGYDRLGLPCNEPVAYDVRDTEGGGGPMCAGHAADARLHLVGATVTALGDQA